MPTSHPALPSLSRRSAGVLLHVTSLPGGLGCGDAGPAARRFVDELASAGVTWWQTLPLHPVGRGPGYSPYSAPSAFAISPLVVSPEDLVNEGLLKRSSTVKGSDAKVNFPATKVNFPATLMQREKSLREAVAAFVHGGGTRSAAYRRFVEAEGYWVHDWAMFAAAREAFGGREWTDWPVGIARHEPKSLAAFEAEHAGEVEYHRVVQFLAERQWQRLREYAAKRGVGLIGDVPIFVSHDSADVWAHRGLFKLDGKGKPTVVTGVPPDVFSRLGQKWNHPHYAWKKHEASGFDWFVRRFERVLSGFDVVRIDHFLGFNRVWEIPGKAKDARRGAWVKSPGHGLFETLKKRLKGRSPIIAEDLGVSTPEATALRERFGFPGMRVLQFGFGGGTEHLPLAYVPNCVAYTGTHDNETSAQWFLRIMKKSPRERESARALGLGGTEPAWQMVAMVANSAANTVIFPVQDLMQLGGEHRMNVPGTAAGNWRWRMSSGLPKDVIARLRTLLQVTARTK